MFRIPTAAPWADAFRRVAALCGMRARGVVLAETWRIAPSAGRPRAWPTYIHGKMPVVAGDSRRRASFFLGVGWNATEGAAPRDCVAGP